MGRGEGESKIQNNVQALSSIAGKSFPYVLSLCTANLSAEFGEFEVAAGNLTPLLQHVVEAIILEVKYVIFRQCFRVLQGFMKN